MTYVDRVLIGARVLHIHYFHFKRKSKDIDYAIRSRDVDKFKSTPSVEYLVNDALFEYYEKFCDKIPRFISLNELYTLKISHLFWDLPNNSWDKHIWDVNFMQENTGFLQRSLILDHENINLKFIPELFELLYNYWNIIHGPNKRSNLEMTSEEFFDNAITYPIPHDDLHELLVKHPYFEGNGPTYKKILKDGAEVDVCMEKFKNLSEKDKFNLVIEEVFCMSVERYPKEMNYRKQFGRMLKKFILHHCKIEEGIWIIMNHKKLITNIPFDYVKFLNNQIK